MKNFYEIRHLRKKCFLNIYILVPIFIPLKMSFLGTRIFQEPFWRCSAPLRTLVFWLKIEKCLKFHILKKNQNSRQELANNVVFTVKFPVFSGFTGQKMLESLK